MLSDIALIAWFDLQKAGIEVVNFVHDEMVCQVPINEKEEYQKKVHKIMIDAARMFTPDFKMDVESWVCEVLAKVLFLLFDLLFELLRQHCIPIMGWMLNILI